MKELLLIIIVIATAITLAFGVITLFYCLFELLTMFLSEKIFPCWSKTIYKKQWKSIIGIFYSFRLRKQFGYKKGYWFDYETKEFMKPVLRH